MGMTTEADTTDRGPAAPAARELPGRLRLTVGRLARLLARQVDADDLTVSQWSALATIARCGPLRTGELGDREHVSVPTLSRLVSDLEARGLVERRLDPADARAHRLTVTAAGRQWLGKKHAATALLAGLLDDLSPSQRDAVAVAVPALEVLVDRLSRHHVPDPAT